MEDEKIEIIDLPQRLRTITRQVSQTIETLDANYNFLESFAKDYIKYFLVYLLLTYSKYLF